MSITVYGCVAFPAGTITFENLETCLEQSACIIFEGVHAGQIALTLSGATNNEDCNDTFYGCMNWTTGKFQVEIPTDCCVTYPECPCEPYSDLYYQCYPLDKTPKNLLIRFSDVYDCNDSLLSINGQWFCIQGFGSDNNYCASPSEGFCISYQPYMTMYYPYRFVSFVFLVSVENIEDCCGGDIGNFVYFCAENSPCATIFPNALIKSQCDTQIACAKSNQTVKGYGGSCQIITDCICLAELWATGHNYFVADEVKLIGSDEVCYRCILPHVSDDTNKPPNLTYWVSFT